MNFKALILTGSVVGMALHGCTSMGGLNSDSLQKFSSAQELIDNKNINASNGAAKEYVYYWDPKQSNQDVQSLIPKKYLSSYCNAKGGKFSLLQKSSMSLIKESWTKKLLSTYSSVHQGVGAYQCLQEDGQRWIVSIEPVAERKLDTSGETRVVSLHTKMMTADEVKKFYSSSIVSTVIVKKTKADTQVNKNIVANTAAQKKAEEKKNSQQANQNRNQQPEIAVKPAEKVVETAVKPVEKIVDKPQTQQMKLFVAARKDLNKGQNQINACNNAEKAYNYGKLYGSSGINAYAESGVLFARCLTNVPAYSSKFSNPKAKAAGILQNLASNQNHTGAKHMLKQLK
ncbi:hypothetical protein [Acinetobacter sp. ANC 4648]|uniref:hypothetical protein n=1 Tax=Acinetobacter sp. ANC 4648 TaxID=1977875 RepID=UPI000B555BFB|nr:hypothetical protein [Acinetobacter sp. ANC 4648]OTG81072.1 hypothetical protein B9T27_11465 [Acinetobacter sp. ANC 4648]